jgi:peptidoglycan/LPS O-acetylase OafA/YrhL
MFGRLPSDKDNSFNAVRLFAALQVVYFHSFYYLKTGTPVLTQMFQQVPGVPVFFALSGCLVLDSCLRARSVGEYGIKRAARIYPALLLNIIVLELLMQLTGAAVSASWPRTAFYEFLYGLTASDFIAADTAGVAARAGSLFFPFYPSGVLWTLTVELSFYLVVPLLAMLSRSRVLMTSAIVALSVASFYYLTFVGVKASPYSRAVVSVSVIPYFWMFAIGMLFRLWLPSVRLATLMIVPLVLALIAITVVRGNAWPDWRDLPPLILSAQMVIVGLLALCLGMSKWLRNDLLRRYDLSFGIYLWHMLAVTTLLALGFVGQWWLLPTVLGCTGAIALVSWVVLERPVTRFVRGQRLKPPAA